MANNSEFPFNESLARSPILMILLSKEVPTVSECFLSTLNFYLFLTLKTELNNPLTSASCSNEHELIFLS